MGVRLDHGDETLDEIHEINVTPFIDVILVLLIIFMIAAPLATVDVSVDLPAANAQRTQRPDKPLYLTLKSDLSLALDNDTIARAALAAQLDAATSGDKEQRVFLRADKTVPYGDLMALMNELRSRRLSACRTGRASPAMIARLPNALRWCACFGIALGIHAAGAAVLIARWNDSADAVANAPVIMIDLAPAAVAPQTTPTEAPPDQVESKQQIEPDPVPEKPPEITKVEPEPEKPVENAEPKPEPETKAELAMLPPPKPPELEKPVEEKKEVKKKPRHRNASLASAPSAADQKAERAAAPAPGANARDPDALRNWTSQLVAQIERHKRYPAEAGGATGTAVVSFSVDRSGGAHHTRIVRSSGDSMLDHDAVAWVERSQPLPPPPADRSGNQIPVVVPLTYKFP